MTLSQQLFEARNPGRWEILGRRLNPLTVGACELIEGLDLSSDGVSKGDLLTAIRVCSMPYEKAKRYLLRGGWSLWAIRATIAMHLRPIMFRTAVELFKAYLKAGKKLPNFWSDSKQTGESSCPQTMLFLRDLPSRYSAEQIMEMPIAEAHWHRLVAIEKHGALEFIEDDIIERAKAMARQVAEEEAAKDGVHS
jgi:hypothetical protein